MRRLVGLVVVAVIVAIPAMAALGEPAEFASYEDGFSNAVYSGNDGTLDFGGPWMEFGDGGGYSSGKVHVGSENCSDSYCLHLEGEGPIGVPFGINRSADLSFFKSANLSFDIEVQAVPTDEAGLRVEVWTGSTWATLKSYDLSKSNAQPTSFSLKNYLRQDFAVRFVVVGSSFSGWVTIDRVAVTGSATPPPPTTTSTTSTSTTSTSTTSTTSTTTTSTTTTTTVPTTTTTEPTTSTSEPRRTTTTTEPTTTTAEATTTTTPSTTTTTSSTTTTVVAAAGGDDATPRPPVFQPGIHDMGPGHGLMFDLQPGASGNLDTLDDVEVLSAEVTANFSLAVEVFKSTKIWMAALGLMIAAALVSGMDYRRKVKDDFLSSPGQALMQG